MYLINNKDTYLKYTKSLERDYMMTEGQRADDRGLNTIAHRRGLVGRRNKFVVVPKVYWEWTGRMRHWILAMCGG